MQVRGSSLTPTLDGMPHGLHLIQLLAPGWYALSFEKKPSCPNVYIWFLPCTLANEMTLLIHCVTLGLQFHAPFWAAGHLQGRVESFRV